MLFNSIEFAVFLPVVFAAFWLLSKSHISFQNTLLLLASYVFYGWWDWRFLSLIIFSSLVDYTLGLLIHKEKILVKRKILLFVSLIVNLGFLGFFKYYNFFIDSFVEAFTLFGSEINPDRLAIILPVGISFYTFQTLSYTIDIYRRQLEPTKNVLAFFTFVSFFPQLVAGPIERASHLLPQFLTKRQFDYKRAVSGVQLIVWGFFKKMVIADNAAVLVNGIFSDYESQTSASLIVGMLLFAFQIYGDFSGYSDIAIGTGRLFGFDLMTNFRFPYLSKGISEFWKRWHISLSTWFRDYLYIPLGGSRGSQMAALRNIFIVFVVSGFWHGANWTFIAWGFIHGLLYIPMFVTRKSKEISHQASRTFKNLSGFASWLAIFTFVCFAWIFFRSPSITDAWSYITMIFDPAGSSSYFTSTGRLILLSVISFTAILCMMAVEFYFNKKNLREVRIKPRYLLLVALAICFLGAFKDHASFIYFQF
ncbi:membrane-bound O-acyltransferase family protein [Nonlabens spongiae]|uniref:Membrane-bound O-acyltransferase family protein n=1 Tax=Nonlabens spongiae TaxID=331648 RepID=A0A1W6MJI5_9FLAO|nr:MBOAT family O-acyltransferase [Nonlabens spongiae]ARN77656.1 membrane-bound O-acyltransferase family protein [Nonlabens spongiae]